LKKRQKTSHKRKLSGSELKTTKSSMLTRVLTQGSKKALSSCPVQVDFPAGQETFHSHLPNGQGPRQVVLQLSKKKSKLRLAQGMQAA